MTEKTNDPLTLYRRAVATMLCTPAPMGVDLDDDVRVVVWLKAYVDALERCVGPDLPTVREFAALEARTIEGRKLLSAHLWRPRVKPSGE